MLGIHVVTTASTYTTVPSGHRPLATSLTAARLHNDPSMAKRTFICNLLFLSNGASGMPLEFSTILFTFRANNIAKCAKTLVRLREIPRLPGIYLASIRCAAAMVVIFLPG
jgi:hypothetical protein